MFSLFDKFEPRKLQTNLNLTANRANLLQSKKTEISKKKRKEIAKLISEKRYDSARIQVEMIIHEDYLVEVLELIEIYCQQLSSRINLIENTKEVHESLEKATASVLWVAPRLVTELKELNVIKDQFKLKYKEEYVNACIANNNGKVDERILVKMSPNAPPEHLVENYMVEIARLYETPFTPDPAKLKPKTQIGTLIDVLDTSKLGFSSPFGPPPLPLSSNFLDSANEKKSVNDIVNSSLDKDSGLNNFILGSEDEDEKSDKKTNASPPPYMPTAPSLPKSDINLPDPSNNDKPSNEDNKSEDIDFDDLTRRFDALKKKT